VGLPGKGQVDVAPTGSWAPSPPPKREVPTVSEGDTVVHERWGEGVVVAIKGHGDDAEATIAFSEAGEKRLLLSYAPLTRVG
jgi:DNA helicase-2/ATP-dependent DNA helicase PcrA